MTPALAQEVTPRSPSFHGGDPGRTLDLREPDLSTLRPALEYDYSKNNPRFRTMVPLSRKCGTIEVEQELETQGIKSGSEEDFEEWLNEQIEAKQATRSGRRTAEQIFTLPVVVHVIYSNPLENISDAQVMSQIEVLNQDYRRQNPDRDRTPRQFEDDAADTGIEFCMATVDPNGNPTDGIHRVSFSGSPFTEGYINSVIKPSTIWDPGRYFNIWVCYIADGILGFAQFPDPGSIGGIPAGTTGASTDGVVINYRAFGTTGTVSHPFNHGRTATHEIGHWLGLRHVWGDGGCGIDDYCDDTPITADPHYNCPTSSIGCNGAAAMASNYMDYTDDACMNLFTRDQRARMRRVVESSPRRVSLLASNACQARTTPPEPAFVADVRSGCGPLEIQFTDQSEGEVEEYAWVFPGGRPSTSKKPNPEVTYRKPGVYPVTLRVSNAGGARTETKESYVEVLASGVQIPYIATFESDAFPPGGLRLYNSEDDYTWQRTARVSGGGQGNGSLVINHFDNHLKGSLDWLVTPVMDFSGQSEVALTFKVAYAPYSQRYSDTLGIFIATECGSTFRSIYYKGGEELATAPDYQQPFIPAADEWRTESIDLSQWAGMERVQIAIVSRSGYGNDIYLDDFSVAPVGPEAPEPEFVASETTVCAGESIRFEDRSSGAINRYVWSFPGGTPASDTTARPVISYPKPGTYPVSLTVIGPGGTQRTTREDFVVVNNVPQVRLDATKKNLCLGEEVTLTASGQGPFFWDLAEETVTPSGDQVTFEPSGDATYRISTPQNTFGCVGTAEVSVRVGQGRNLQVDPPQTLICLGESVKLQATGAQQYQWSPANTLDNASSGLVYAKPSRTTTYTVMGLSPGCTTEQKVTITVESPPSDFMVSADLTQLCSGEKATLRASGAATFRWAPVGSLNRPEGSTVVALPRRDTRYTVTALSENGCEATKEIDIRVGTKPDMVLRANQTRICPGDEVLLAASGANRIQWQSHPTLSPQGSSARAFPTENTRFTVYGSSIDGCLDTAFIDIVVTKGEPLELVASRETVCPGERVVLTAAGGQNFIWGNNPAIERVNGASATAVINRNEVFTVEAIDNQGCASQARIEVSLADGFESEPYADFTVNQTTTCLGQEVQFTSTSTDAVQYLWEFQGGEPATSLEANPRVQFFDEGIHDVKLTVRGCGGQQAEKSEPGFIFVTAPIDLQLNTTDASVCAGSSFRLEASGAITYEWSPSIGLDRTTGPVVNASIDSERSYTVTATDASGCQATETVHLGVIEVDEDFAPSVTPFEPAICQGESVTLQAQGGATYSWTPSEGLDRSNGAIVRATPDRTTTYRVDIATLEGCSFQREVTVTVRDTAALSLTPENPTICAGDKIDLRVGAEGVFQWAPAYGLSATTGRKITAYPEETTTYSIVGTDKNGCRTRGKITVDVRKGPNLQVSATDATICTGTTTELTAEGEGPFSWSPTAALIDTVGRVVTAAPKVTTTYTVRAGSGSCQGEAKVTIEVLEPIPLTISPEDPEVCPGQGIELSATNGRAHRWSGPGLSSNYGATVSVQPSETSPYRINGIDEQGCETKGLVSVKVGQSNFVEASSSVSSVCQGEEIELIASGAKQYQWIGGEVSEVATARTYARPEVATTYTVVGTNEQGCRDTTDLTVTVGSLDVQFLMSSNRIDLANGLGVIDFTDKTPNAVQWRWDFGEGGQADSPNPTHVYDQVGNYEIIFQATDGVCSGVARQQLVVVNSSSLEALEDEGLVSVTSVTRDGLVDLALESPRDMYLKMRLLDDRGTQIVNATLRLRPGPYRQQLNLSSFPKGTYHLQLLDGMEALTREIRYQ